MILKADVKLTDKYVFTLDISVNTFYDVPWSTLGKKVTFCIDAKESMEMFEKHAKIWKWKISGRFLRKRKKQKGGSKKFKAFKYLFKNVVNESDRCPVCLENYNTVEDSRRKSTIRCGHTACFGCFRRILLENEGTDEDHRLRTRAKCPKCRKNFVFKYIIKLYD
jgi:hypothetical protein